MAQAPYFEDAAGLPGGVASWLTASDGVRIRMVRWPIKAAKGTVFILPGRTEYAEKYGRIATLLAERGYASLAIDWRGQGLADRLLADRQIGHVESFTDFQRDLTAVIDAAAGMPRPWVMLAHSMGGCIGLRALMGDHPFDGAAFSAPMWGINIPPMLRPVAIGLASASRKLKLGDRTAPGQKRASYVEDESFGANALTTDEESWNWMRSHLRAHPELGLGGPSLNWLHEALAETRALHAMLSPDLPALAWLGSDESIVDPARIRARMARWTLGGLEILPSQRHEVLMESPARRAARVDEITAFATGLS